MHFHSIISIAQKQGGNHGTIDKADENNDMDYDLGWSRTGPGAWVQASRYRLRALYGPGGNNISVIK